MIFQHIREEFHRGVSNSTNTVSKTQTSAFFSNVSDNKKKPAFRRSPLVYKHCGANGHTIERCFKLIGFPKDFQSQRKRSFNTNFKSVSSNNSVIENNGS